MADVIFFPKDFARGMISDKHLARLVTNKLTLNKIVMRQVASLTNMTQKEIEEIALKVLKSYRSRYKELIESGQSKSSALKGTLNDKKLIVNRVKDEVIYKASESLKEKYAGHEYIWLPSDSAEPDPRHQAKYGKTYIVGKGEMPQDRYGCKCGMRIKTN